jgi:hypothetical protein
MAMAYAASVYYNLMRIRNCQFWMGLMQLGQFLRSTYTGELAARSRAEGRGTHAAVLIARNIWLSRKTTVFGTRPIGRRCARRAVSPLQVSEIPFRPAGNYSAECKLRAFRDRGRGYRIIARQQKNLRHAQSVTKLSSRGSDAHATLFYRSSQTLS